MDRSSPGTFATAAGPHAGGAGTGDYVARLDAFGAETLRTMIHVHGHSATALGVGSVLLWVLARRRGVDGRPDDARSRRSAS